MTRKSRLGQFGFNQRQEARRRIRREEQNTREPRAARRPAAKDMPCWIFCVVVLAFTVFSFLVLRERLALGLVRE